MAFTSRFRTYAIRHNLYIDTERSRPRRKVLKIAGKYNTYEMPRTVHIISNKQWCANHKKRNRHLVWFQHEANGDIRANSLKREYNAPTLPPTLTAGKNTHLKEEKPCQRQRHNGPADSYGGEKHPPHRRETYLINNGPCHHKRTIKNNMNGQHMKTPRAAGAKGQNRCINTNSKPREAGSKRATCVNNTQ